MKWAASADTSPPGWSWSRASASPSHQVTSTSETPAAVAMRCWDACFFFFHASLTVGSHDGRAGLRPLAWAMINGYLAEAIEHYRTREEVLWLQCTSLLCSLYPSRYALQLFVLWGASKLQEGEIYPSFSFFVPCWVNVKSAFSTQNLISFLVFFI